MSGLVVGGVVVNMMQRSCEADVLGEGCRDCFLWESIGGRIEVLPNCRLGTDLGQPMTDGILGLVMEKFDSQPWQSKTCA